MTMKIFVFGNEDIGIDNKALLVAKKLAVDLAEIEWTFLKPNQDLPLTNERDVIIMDVVEGLKEATLIRDGEIDKIILPPRGTAHDFDLGFQLNYLKKLGRLGKITIIGLPMTGKIDYKRIHSILKKLVAQDMHGS